MRRGLMLAGLAACLAGLASAQTFETAADHPGDAKYFLPDYPLAFVAARVNEVPDNGAINGLYHIGTDVLSANNPDGGHHLWIVLPDGQVKKLFPLPQHENVNLPSGHTLIDSPPGQLDVASVVEPNISEDGRRLYFSYFHDATLETSNSFSIHRLPTKGADLYALDLGPLLDNPATDPATLAVQRLTFREYNGSGGQSDADKNKNAMNPQVVASTGPNGWGNVYMHAVEMRTATGLKLVYVTDEKRLLNANQSMSLGDANHNFNLYLADINADGSISNPRQWQYYTTTSALSPNRLRNGIAFSYQATTADARTWHIQGIDSAGRWFPVLGYGINPELFHLASLCVKTQGANPGDYLVATRYYNFNNEGFGSLWALDMRDAGTNEYDVSTFWGTLPRQVGSYEISTPVISQDNPSPKQNGLYIGKITSPRCGRPDELYLAYTPTSANGRLPDDEGNKHIYHSHIAYRPNLETFHPLDPVNLSTQSGLQVVVDDTSNAYTLVWPTPVIPWSERLGGAGQQSFSQTIVAADTPVAAGVPHALVGTSALYNTDRRPFDCWLGPGQTPFSPNDAYVNSNQENDLILNNTAPLTVVQNQADFCAPVDPASVLGVAVNLTSNKSNLSAGFNAGYETDGSGRNEASALLGVYDVRGQGDTSFLARIPARSPFELHLLDARYGLKMTDVRSWHSLQPRETRSDCGGCHNHVPGQAIPFAGTVADTQPALDMTGATPHVDYDASCTPQLVNSGEAARSLPEWKADIWPGFDSYCGDCHREGAGNAAALAALSFNGESQAWNRLRARNYADVKLGALGSPAFWAARGERADGRDNTLTKYQPNYASQDWGYRHHAGHSADPGLCSGHDADAARWVYRFGQWIDHHMPRDTGANYPFQFDWYHPSVDVALSTADCSAEALRVGYWDDTGSLASVTLAVDGRSVRALNAPDNGSFNQPVRPMAADDSVVVEAIDSAGNRQEYAISAGELVARCQIEKLASETLFRDSFE